MCCLSFTFGNLRKISIVFLQWKKSCKHCALLKTWLSHNSALINNQGNSFECIQMMQVHFTITICWNLFLNSKTFSNRLYVNDNAAGKTNSLHPELLPDAKQSLNKARLSFRGNYLWTCVNDLTHSAVHSLSLLYKKLPLHMQWEFSIKA